MAAQSTRQYNLHSNGQETIQLPVELHMAEDSTFMKDLLASKKTSLSGQVSDNDSSIRLLVQMMKMVLIVNVVVKKLVLKNRIRLYAKYFAASY